MRESFSEYKKTIESNLIQIPFLYSGDVIKSKIQSFNETRDKPLTSPSFIIKCINDIYEKSFFEMMSRSQTLIVSEESLIGVNFISKLEELNIGHNFIFMTGRNRNLFGDINQIDNNKPFPKFFYEVKKYVNKNVSVFLSNLIIEEGKETVIYVTNRPIQSLVYSIQNMEYKITPHIDNDIRDSHLMKWNHTIDYPYYNCDYDCYKIVIKNISEIRHQKINKILNDN